MPHPRYNEPEWRHRWPFERWSHYGRAPHEEKPVFSPRTITMNEQIRERIWPELTISDGVPCDVFVWAWGLPQDRTLTRIGGVPFRPADRPWPRDSEGRLMGFVAQINFTDSLDLVPNLPGDILVVFAKISFSDGKYFCFEFDELIPSTVTLEWYRADEVTDPLKVSPETTCELWPLHGVIHRTCDYPDRDYEAMESRGIDVDSDPIYADAFPPAILRGTKIGGVPRWEQGDCGLKGSFFCQLSSDLSYIFLPEPYLGHEQQIPSDQLSATDNRRLGICDQGTMYLLVDGDQVTCAVDGG